MLLRLHPIAVPPCFTLHLAVRDDLPIPSDAVWFGELAHVDQPRTLHLHRGQSQPGINSDAVLNAAADRGWTVLGSGFV
jgi:hypothetical protein